MNAQAALGKKFLRRSINGARRAGGA